MNYKIAICSLNRADQVHSITTLLGHGFNKEDIDLFVANEEQKLEYEKFNPGINIIVGVLGMKAIREFITNYYPEGTKVLCMDDDIMGFRMKNPREWEESCFCDDELDLKAEIDLAWEECEKSGRHMWGVYPVNNHFFMTNKISYDYKFCCGQIFGLIIKRELCELNVNQYEDYERCIKHYLADGGVVRLNYICVKSPKMDSNSGGFKNRDYEGDCKILQKLYPNLFYLKEKKGMPHPNPTLKDTRSHRGAVEGQQKNATQ